MKNLIISLAVKGREDYPKIQQGLCDSIFTLPYTGDRWIFTNVFPAFCTPHSVIPYKFKFDLIWKAKKDGYDKVFWLDSTMRLLKDPFELLEQSEPGVVAFHNEGHPLYKYISNHAALNLQSFYNDLYSIPQTWGGAIGFDFTKQTANDVFIDIILQAESGSFNDGSSNREGFVSHRHDQAVMSVLFDYYKVPLLPYGVIAAKKDVSDKTYIQYGD